ncbi:hypothetical protein [Streptomyces bambusae]|uniref:Ricin B lectin domain-containing protein n=1 Tax=Streptomyces bambusae TaxID=1550616 RepID=A0ABS6Z5D6_9ACTN|nr:hypothetical protein [Streptomyces bambusae]MBW5481925.1 hypothetical protein [Streptomyces bambusae]
MNRHLRRTRNARHTAALACAAALTVLAAGSASATPAPAPAQQPTPGQTYVMAPQERPDQWLGDADYYGEIVCRASRLWYGNRHDDAVWRISGNNDGSISLVNTDAEQFGQSLTAAGDAIFIQQGQGDAYHWYTVAGPGGTVALRNKVTGRYLMATATGAVVSAVNAYWWYMVNTRP